METFEETIVVDVPLKTAYNQWTQFEEFPRFMESVESVTQQSDRMLHWVAEVAGKREEWDAEIVDQRPDERVAWRSVGGKTNAGAVWFEPVTDTQTRVTLQMGYEPDGIAERVADAIGIVERRVRGDLERFKRFIEARGVETGAWRGEIDR